MDDKQVFATWNDPWSSLMKRVEVLDNKDLNTRYVARVCPLDGSGTMRVSPQSLTDVQTID